MKSEAESVETTSRTRSSCARVACCCCWVYDIIALVTHKHTHEHLAAGHAIKYAKFYASANENSKRQSADKSQLREWSRRGVERGTAVQVCLRTKAHANASPATPVWENMSAEARDAHGSHGVCVIFVYDLHWNQICTYAHTRAKMH